MVPLQKIIPILKTMKSDKSVHTLQFMSVVNGVARYTPSIEQSIQFTTDTPDGTYDYYRLIKLKAWAGAQCEFNYDKDIPEYQKLGDFTSVPLSVFDCDLIAVSKCTSNDQFRSVLQGVFFDAINQCAIATDGHRFKMRKLPEAFPLQFIINAVHISTIDTLLGNTDIEDVRINTANTDIEISGDGIMLTTKLIQDPYPDCLKVVPKVNQIGAPITQEQYLTVLSAVKALLPYANPETHMIVFCKNKIITRNRDNNDSFYGVDLGFTPITAVDTIAFNGEYFLDVFKADKANEITFLGSTAVRGLSIQESTGIDLLMPLRLSEDKEKIPDYANTEFIPVQLTIQKSVKTTRKLNKEVAEMALMLQDKLGAKNLINLMKGLDLV